MKAKLYRRVRTDTAVNRATARHGKSHEAVLPVLQNVQSETGYLDANSIGATSDELNLSDAQTFGAASFYSMLSTRPRSKNVIRVCDGPVCMACGGGCLGEELAKVANEREWTVERTSCLGLCDRAPAALVHDEAAGPIVDMTLEDLISGWRGDAPSYDEPLPGEVRVRMARIGKIDPASIDSALELGAYQVLSSVLRRSTDDLLVEIETSGLRGCGGAGFPTARKMRMVAETNADKKYVICNADESEPLTFKDRVLMEGDPHLLLEGMAIAAYAVGANHGIIYIRGEYERAARFLEQAIDQATKCGYVGDNINGSGCSFHIQVHRGAGAYICGEETALLESLEGRRGEPRIRPPYPTTIGYFGKPTLINNVETLCALPPILAHGGEWYRSLGSGDAAGTKMFTVMGHVNRTLAFEAPLGITLRTIIEEFAGGMRAGSKFKMALAGGAAGTIVGPDVLDVPLDFDSHKSGVTLGSGGFLVLDDSVSALELLGWLLHFFEVESCGKCTPCREGTREARLVLERVFRNAAKSTDIEQLRWLVRMLGATSLCGLGQSVAWPIDSALANFREEFGI